MAGERPFERRIDRRMLMKLSGLTAVSGLVSSRALADHHPPPYPNRPPGHYPPISDGGGGVDEGDIPTPTELPDRIEPTIRTVHDRGDAVIERFQHNIDATNFGVWGDERSGLLCVSQRLTDHIAVFDRSTGEYVQLFYVPTLASGSHAVRIDEASNSAWFANGESSKIGRLVLDPDTLRPHNFVEYTVPGDVRPERKPHGIAVVDDEVWYTDDRGDRVGWLDVPSGLVRVIDEHVEADGIAVEDRRPGRGGAGILRIWVAGGSEVTVVDVREKKVLHRITIPEEPGVSQLRLHDLHYDSRLNRVWVLMRGGDHATWFDADHPERGAQEFINPGEYAAGFDHMDLGERYVWWTEGLRNNVTRYDPATGEVKPYEVPAPTGYFNPHGIWVSQTWREVWFTELESLCRLTFKDGRAP